MVKFFQSSVVQAVVFTVLVILFSCGLCVYAIYDDITVSVKRREQKVIQVEETNRNSTKLIELKGRLNGVVKDVIMTSHTTHTNILLNRDFSSAFNVSENETRKRTWEKKIVPVMNQIDHDMDNGFGDDVKANFNKINDKVFEIYNLQEKIVYEFLTSGGADPRDVDRLVSKTRSIGRKHNAFLNSTEEVVVDVPTSELITEDSIKVWAVLFFVVAIIILMVSWLIGYLRKPIIKLESALGELRNGDFPEDLKIRSLDHKPSGRAINVISKKLKVVRDYTAKVAVGDFEVSESEFFDRDGMLGNSLANMQENLQRIAERDKQREHINKGLASFSDILSSHTNNLAQFAEEVTHNLVSFLNANQGALFIVMDEEEKANTMEMHSCYAYNTKKYEKKTVKKGQGLVGQAWVEKKRIYMTDVPDGYTRITSGLGYSTPRCILIIPLVFNDEVHGVMELASFNELQDYELDFVDEVTDSISSSLSSVKINSQTQELLKQSEELTGILTEQEEEMRKKVEELAVIQNEAQLREEQQIREIRRLENRIKAYERHV